MRGKLRTRKRSRRGRCFEFLVEKYSTSKGPRLYTKLMVIIFSKITTVLRTRQSHNLIGLTIVKWDACMLEEWPR